MIAIESIGSDILIRGRNADKTRYEKRIKDFKPYFYVKADELQKPATHVSLYGDALVKVEVNKPGDIKTKRTKFKSTFEADVIYTNRYIIDTYYDKTIEAEPFRICAIDIETNLHRPFQYQRHKCETVLLLLSYRNRCR